MTGSIKMRHLGVLTVTFLFCLVLTGCGDGGINKANFEKIKDGDSLAAVEKVMGSKGTEVNEESMKKMGITATGKGLKVVRWGDDNKYIAVTIMDDKVMFKANKGF